MSLELRRAGGLDREGGKDLLALMTDHFLYLCEQVHFYLALILLMCSGLSCNA